jgi:hypothetical protein
MKNAGKDSDFVFHPAIRGAPAQICGHPFFTVYCPATTVYGRFIHRIHGFPNFFMSYARAQ